MHEQSLIRALLTQVAELAELHHASQVDVIEVELGPLSGVETLLLQSAFERRTPQDLFRATSLLIHEIPLTAGCVDCRTEFVPTMFRFICPQCSSTNVNVIRGDEVRLLTVTVQSSEVTAGPPHSRSAT